MTPVIDFAFALVILFGLMFYYHFAVSIIGILLIPILLFISLLSAAGLGFFFASLNVKYRDVRVALPFFIQLMMFLTPVIYPVSIIPQQYQWIAFLNPMAGVITVARQSLLGTEPIDWILIFISLGIAIIFVIGGVTYFRKTERYFADII